VRAGGLLFIAGSVGFRADGTIPVSVAEQSEIAMQRIVEILHLEGLTMEDLVEIVSYHVDLEANLPEFIAVKERYVPAAFSDMDNTWRAGVGTSRVEGGSAVYCGASFCVIVRSRFIDSL